MSHTLALEPYNTNGILTYGTAEILRASPDTRLQARAERMRACLRYLRHYDDGHVWPMYACRDPLCSCCHGGRGRVIRRYLNALPQVSESHNGALLHACLTVRNVAARDLRATVGDMNKAFNGRLLRVIRYSLDGDITYFRKLEVTRGPDGSAHPHIHALFAVPQGWAGEHSLPRMWKDAGTLQYDPNVRVDDIPQADYERALRYILKQPVKVTAEMLSDPGFILAAATGLAGVRTLSAGGDFKRFANTPRSEAPQHSHQRGTYVWTPEGYRKSNAYSA